MPKHKTHSGAKKTFRKTGSGKIMHERAGKRHLLEHKSSRLTRRLSTDAVASEPSTYTAKRMLGLK
jgi:large subunit ribosomal protein L35